MNIRLSVKSAPIWGLIVVFLSHGVAFALQGLGVAPPRFELLMQIGESITNEVAVYAQDTDRQTILPSVIDWTLMPDGKVVVLNTKNRVAHPYSAAQWLHMSYDPFDLEPDKATTINFEVEVPSSNSLAGSYWTALAFTTKPRPDKYKGVSVLVNTRVLSIVYITIQGTEKPASELQGISIETGEGGMRFVIADVVNKGNVYLRLNGELRFVNAKGEVAKRVPLPERVLLRDGLVRYRLQVPEDLPEDVVLAAIEIQPQGPAKTYGGPPLYGETAMR